MSYCELTTLRGYYCDLECGLWTFLIVMMMKMIIIYYSIEFKSYMKI